MQDVRWRNWAIDILLETGEPEGVRNWTPEQLRNKLVSVLENADEKLGMLNTVNSDLAQATAKSMDQLEALRKLYEELHLNHEDRGRRLREKNSEIARLEKKIKELERTADTRKGLYS